MYRSITDDRQFRNEILDTSVRYVLIRINSLEDTGICFDATVDTWAVIKEE